MLVMFLSNSGTGKVFKNRDVLKTPLTQSWFISEILPNFINKTN